MSVLIHPREIQIIYVVTDCILDSLLYCLSSLLYQSPGSTYVYVSGSRTVYVIVQSATRTLYHNIVTSPLKYQEVKVPEIFKQLITKKNQLSIYIITAPLLL